MHSHRVHSHRVHFHSSTPRTCAIRDETSVRYRYCICLEENPFATKAATSFLGFMLGDVLAQTLEGASAVDAARVLRLGSYGLLLDGPVGHLWYKYVLSRRDSPGRGDL